MPGPTARRFVAEEHIRNVQRGDWVRLIDEAGQLLAGIRGRIGAIAATAAGARIGVDLVEIEPGGAFPLHVHPGDHILYVCQGGGVVLVDGVEHSVEPGDTIFIPAEYPHAVRGPADGEPMVFLAVGHPHRPLDAPDRMRVV